MVPPAERAALRRLGTLKLVAGGAAVAACVARERAFQLSLPMALAAGLAAGGALLVAAGLMGRRPGVARALACGLEFGLILAAAKTSLISHVAPVPPWWQTGWYGHATLAVIVLNGAAAPALYAIGAALLGTATGWLVGDPLSAAAASLAVIGVALVSEPIRREALPADLPRRLARASGRPSQPAGAAAEAEQPPIGESELRGAAAMLGAEQVAVLVHDQSRRQRVPSGDLYVVQGGTYDVCRVTLDAATADRPDGLGCFLPPGLRCSDPFVKRMYGQAGELGRVIVGGWRAERREGSAQEALLALVAATWSLRLDNHRLAQDAESRLLDIVESLITGVEAKDPYTSGHSKRVCRYSLLIAEAAGITGRELDEIAIGAALHDVGKLGIPEQVLSKAAKLDDAEWSLMKSHPKVGGKIIDSFNQSRAVLHMIVHHHERYDGKGYPAGLAGEAVPLHARIVGVADALDAMTSGRVYQRNRTMVEAVEEVKTCAGKQFDPDIVTALLRIPLARLQAIAPDLPVQPAPMPELVPLRVAELLPIPA